MGKGKCTEEAELSGARATDQARRRERRERREQRNADNARS
jgi:hypothetical protein